MKEIFANDQIAILCIAQFFAVYAIVIVHKYTINYNMVSKLANRMHSIARSTIGFSPNCYVEIEGESYSPNKKTIRSPISNTPCVFWAVKIINKKTRRIERVQYADEMFFIKDSTGSALICPGKLTEILLDTKHKTSHLVNSDFIKINEKFLSNLNIKVSESTHDIEETAVPGGTHIYATGNLIAIPGKNIYALAQALKDSNIRAAKNVMDRWGIKGIMTNDAIERSKSVTGKSISPITDEPTLEIDVPLDTESKSFYLFGTAQKPMLISSITETMIDDNHAVLLYNGIPVVAEIITISAILMLSAAYHFL